MPNFGLNLGSYMTILSKQVGLVERSNLRVAGSVPGRGSYFGSGGSWELNPTTLLSGTGAYCACSVNAIWTKGEMMIWGRK